MCAAGPPRQVLSSWNLKVLKRPANTIHLSFRPAWCIPGPGQSPGELGLHSEQWCHPESSQKGVRWEQVSNTQTRASLRKAALHSRLQGVALARAARPHSYSQPACKGTFCDVLWNPAAAQSYPVLLEFTCGQGAGSGRIMPGS